MLQLKTSKQLPPIPVLQGTGWSLDLTVSGQSMEPLIQAGDIVTVKCKKPDALKEGDVICFENNGDFVLHRLLNVNSTDNKCFYEKGDAETKGHWIPGASVLGVLEFINGDPIDPDTAEQITKFSQRESDASELIGRMNLTPPPSALSRSWRKLKNAYRRKFMNEGR